MNFYRIEYLYEAESFEAFIEAKSEAHAVGLLYERNGDDPIVIVEVEIDED